MTITETETVTEKQVMPEVQRYLDAWEADKTNVRDLREKVDNLYYDRHESEDAEKAYQEAYKAWTEARDEKWERHETLVKNLVDETEDKLVKYIAEKWLDEYREQAIVILKALPASMTELDEIAQDHGWCGVWTDAIDGAIEAGAIEVNVIEHTTRKLKRLLDNQMYRSDVKRAMDMVEELVNLRVGKALADKIEAALDAPAGIPE